LIPFRRATNLHAEAEPLSRRALAIDEKSFGPDHPHVAISLLKKTDLPFSENLARGTKCPDEGIHPCRHMKSLHD
jgi:hypothetical protein